MSIAAAASTAASNSTGSSQNALDTLSNNFQDFLGMLMTQLKNQDPTSPLDTNQFTSELVQFSGVAQQINTNSALTQLISLTQSGQMLQSSSMVGKTVQIAADHMPLQNSSGSLTLTAATAGTAEITIANAAGLQVLDTTINTTVGSNTWAWNGKDAQGNTLPDGSYKVKVTGPNAAGAAAALPFTVSGKVTGVVDNSGTLDVRLGAQTAAFSTVQSVSG
jgi:flagellar basal-body rod modification protein FlgD